LALSCFALALLSLALGPALTGQSSTSGALTGTVKDSSGAVVPNATVTVTSIGTGQARTTSTSVGGTYSVGFLPPGEYRVKFEASGFSTETVPSVTVNVTETPVLDQVLTVGSQSQQVEVRSQEEQVQTSTSTLGTVVTSETLTSIPMTTRDYTNLLGLTAGASAGVFDAANMGRGITDIAVNGSTNAQNNFQMDGAPVSPVIGSAGYIGTGGGAFGGGNNPGIGTVSPDALEEFKIQTSMFDAGAGRKPGASVNVVTKTGTNQFHGTAFEFFRNTSLNANDFFRKIQLPVNGVLENSRQALNQNQFGGVFGGPVKKDKLFFFLSYQETRQKNGISPAGQATPTLVGIPLGTRSTVIGSPWVQALGAAFCPNGSATKGGGPSVNGPAIAGATPVACNGSNINPVALNILNLKNAADGSYFIEASSTGVNQPISYSSPAHFTEHQALGNFDWVLNSKNTIAGRWFYSLDLTNATVGLGTTATTVPQAMPGVPGAAHVPTEYVVGKITSTLTNNLVNEARFALQRNVAFSINEMPFTNSSVGIASINPSFGILDSMTVKGLFTWGSPGPSASYVTTWEATDSLSWSHGKHTVRTGFEIERDQQQYHLGSLGVGNLTFSSFQDFLLGLPGCPPGTVGTPSCTTSTNAGLTNGTAQSNISSSGTNASVQPPQGLLKEFRIPASNAFVQDDFKVFSNLTLNIGLRWEYIGLESDNSGNNVNIWPSLINLVNTPVTQGGTLGTTFATGSLAGFVVPSNFRYSIYPAPPVGGLVQSNHQIPSQNSPSKTDFAPRFGFAWKPLASDRFVVRSGAGLFFDRIGSTQYDKGAIQIPPYLYPVFQSGAANYFSSFAQPYVPATLGWQTRWVNINTVNGSGTSSNINDLLMGPIYRSPLTYQWNLNVQYEFLPQWVLELGYVGTRAIHQTPDNLVANAQERALNEAALASPSNPVNGITFNTTANAAVRVPYLGFATGGLQDDETIADAKYNSLQATVRKQFSHGFTMQAAYTWSRGVDTESYVTLNDPDVPLKYGLSPAFRPQRVTINYNWNLPFGSHQGFLDKLTSGWNLSGVTVVQSGVALTVLDTRGGTVYGFGAGTVVNSTAQFVAGMTNANVATTGGDEARLGGAILGGPGWLNKAAFVSTGPPTIGTGNGPAGVTTGGTGYGNGGYGETLGPAQFNWDVALVKTTKVGGLREDATLQFRTEFFNAFNHAQFNVPVSVDVSSSTFGQITSTSVNPRLIQFALKYSF
jgi:hypothetical protein